MALLHQAQQEANVSPHTSGPSFGGNRSHGHTSSSDVQGAAPTHKTSRRGFPLLFGHHRQLMETQALVEAQLWCPPQHTSTSQNGGQQTSPPSAGLHLNTFLPGFAVPLPLTSFALATLQHSKHKFGLLGQLRTRGTQAGKEPPPAAAHFGEDIEHLNFSLPLTHPLLGIMYSQAC